MKKLLHFVAFAMLALLAAQPALAGFTCSMHVAAPRPCAPDCPMSVGALGPRCAMVHLAPATGCPPNCCQSSAQQNLARLSAPAKPKSRGTTLLHLQPDASLRSVSGSAFAPPTAPIDSGPPRYILIRVFRI